MLIAGPSGSGKSTLINLMSGLISPSEGEIILDAKNTKAHYKSIKPFISCVWNENSLFLNMSIIKNLRFFSLLYGQDWEEASVSADNLLHELGIFYERNRFISNLSSGSQRKVDICRALIIDPKLLLLDEPSSLLDNKSKKALLHILLNYKKHQKTIIIVSHHASLYSELIDELIILKSGRIIYNAPVKDLTKDDRKYHNAFILKTSDRHHANDILRSLPEVHDTYVSRKAVHIYLEEGMDIYTVINSLGLQRLKIKKIFSKESNLDKLIGDLVNAN